MKIDVTQADIDEAQRLRKLPPDERPEYFASQHCPLAIALRRQGFKNPAVSSYEFTFDKKEGGFHYVGLPPRAHQFVNAFDGRILNTDLVKPFIFEVDIP